MKKYYTFDFYKYKIVRPIKNPAQMVKLIALGDEETYTNFNLVTLNHSDILSLSIDYISSRMFPLMKSLQDKYGHVFVKNLAIENEQSFNSIYFEISSNMFKVRKAKPSVAIPKTVKEGGIQVTFDPLANQNRVIFEEKLGWDRPTLIWDQINRTWRDATENESKKSKKRVYSSLREIIDGTPEIEYSIVGRKVGNEYQMLIFKINPNGMSFKENNNALKRALLLNNDFNSDLGKNNYTGKRLRELIEKLDTNAISIAERGSLISKYKLLWNNASQINTQREAQKAFEQFQKYLMNKTLFDKSSKERLEDFRVQNTTYFINSVQFNDLEAKYAGQLTQKKELIDKDLSIIAQLSFDRERNQFSMSMRIVDQNNTTLGFFVGKFTGKDIVEKVNEQIQKLKESLKLESHEYRLIDLYYGNIIQELQEFIQSNFDDFISNPSKYIKSAESDLEDYDQKILKRTVRSVFDYPIEGEDTTTVIEPTKPITEPTKPIRETTVVFTDKEKLIIENLAARFSYLSQKKDKPTGIEPPPRSG